LIHVYNFDLICLTFIPIVTYNNAYLEKRRVIKDNEGKAGIYRWTRLNTNKSYVGSSINLGRRLRNYFNPSFIAHSSRKNMVINKALIKYGYENFKLEILEYCDRKDTIKREQYYLDYLKPKYNVLKLAAALAAGYKHSKETLVKISKNLANINKKKVINVKVTNIKTNVSSAKYVSLTDAAKNLNTSRTTLKNYILNSLLFKNIYKLEANIPKSNYDSNYLNHPNAIRIEITALRAELNTKTSYISVRAAARALNINHNTIAMYFKRNQMRPYKGRYIFKKI